MSQHALVLDKKRLHSLMTVVSKCPPQNVLRETQDCVLHWCLYMPGLENLWPRVALDYCHTPPALPGIRTKNSMGFWFLQPPTSMKFCNISMSGLLCSNTRACSMSSKAWIVWGSRRHGVYHRMTSVWRAQLPESTLSIFPTGWRSRGPAWFCFPCICSHTSYTQVFLSGELSRWTY